MTAAKPPNPVLNAFKAAKSSLQLLTQLVEAEGNDDPYLVDAKAFATQTVVNLEKHLKVHGLEVPRD